VQTNCSQWLLKIVAMMRKLNFSGFWTCFQFLHLISSEHVIIVTWNLFSLFPIIFFYVNLHSILWIVFNRSKIIIFSRSNGKRNWKERKWECLSKRVRCDYTMWKAKRLNRWIPQNIKASIIKNDLRIRSIIGAVLSLGKWLNCDKNVFSWLF
jgi:hypothetical protein